MRRPYLLIDGYNLLHAAGLARRRYGPGQLQRARAQLVGFLAQHLTEAERERATIVFDAADAPPNLPREMMAAGIRIRFASAGHEADDTIEELIAGHSAPRQIRLVSSDHRLQRSAQKRRGQFVDSEDFVQELERRGPLPGESPPEPDQTAGAKKPRDTETEQWLAIFGGTAEVRDFVDEAALENTLTQADIARLKKEIDREDVVPRHRGKPGRKRPS